MIALIPMSLILNGCGATPTPECAQARKDFEKALPSLTGFHPATGDVVPAIVAGVALAVVERMPDKEPRERCYNEIMRGRFLSYPPYATVR
jgi:hypothetical protein